MIAETSITDYREAGTELLYNIEDSGDIYCKDGDNIALVADDGSRKGLRGRVWPLSLGKIYILHEKGQFINFKEEKLCSHIRCRFIVG